MASPPHPIPSSSSKYDTQLVVLPKAVAPSKKIYPAVPLFPAEPRKRERSVSRPAVKAEVTAKPSSVVSELPAISEAADPSQKWVIRLHQSLDNLAKLTSVSPSARDDALKAPRLPDCLAAHTSVLSNDAFFRQWHMRYSDDNLNLPGFHPIQNVTMVMGMPIMVPFVSRGSVCNF